MSARCGGDIVVADVPRVVGCCVQVGKSLFVQLLGIDLLESLKSFWFGF